MRPGFEVALCVSLPSHRVRGASLHIGILELYLFLECLTAQTIIASSTATEEQVLIA